MIFNDHFFHIHRKTCRTWRVWICLTVKLPTLRITERKYLNCWPIWSTLTATTVTTRRLRMMKTKVMTNLICLKTTIHKTFVSISTELKPTSCQFYIICILWCWNSLIESVTCYLIKIQCSEGQNDISILHPFSGRCCILQMVVRRRTMMKKTA